MNTQIATSPTEEKFIINLNHEEKSISQNGSLISRNITISGRRTSIRLEPEMWSALRDVAVREGCTIHDIASLVSLRKKPNTSLTAAIRVFLLQYYRAASTEKGHESSNHGSFSRMKQRANI